MATCESTSAAGATGPSTTCRSSGKTRRQTLWRWTGRLTRWILAGIFLYAGITKALDPASLAVQIKNYHLAPWWMVHPLAIVLPWLEIVAGLLCLAGIWLVESVIALAVLLLIFVIGSAWAIYWQLDIECGCFAGHTKAGWTTIGRSLVLLILAAVALLARCLGTWSSVSRRSCHDQLRVPVT